MACNVTILDAHIKKHSNFNKYMYICMRINQYKYMYSTSMFQTLIVYTLIRNINLCWMSQV